jgi:hypothetical protein
MKMVGLVFTKGSLMLQRSFIAWKVHGLEKMVHDPKNSYFTDIKKLLVQKKYIFKRENLL